MQEYEFIGPKNNTAIVEFETRGEKQETAAVQGGAQNKKTLWQPWGLNNKMPDEVVNLIYENNLKPQLLKNQINFILGTDLMMYTESVQDGKIVKEPFINDEISNWLEENQTDLKIRQAAKNFVFFGNYFTEFILTGGKKVASFSNKDCNYIRAQKANNKGVIENYFYSTQWSQKPYYKPGDKNNNVFLIPSFDRSNPTQYEKFIYHGRDYVPGNPYYNVPEWWGTKRWTKLANYIPDWHQKGIENGYNIRYHVKVPANYFDRFPEKERESKYEDFKSEMNKFLTGAENNQKTFVSRFGVDMAGKAIPGFEIQSVKNDLNDAAYTKLFEHSNSANIQGHDIHPTLANISENGKLSSGSEMRNAYNIHLALKTPIPRKILLEPLNIVKKLNGWDPKIKFGFRDVDITTLDIEKTGKIEN